MENASSRSVRISLVVLCSLAVIVALEVGQVVLAPILSAIVIGVVLSPLIDALEKRGIHTVVAAFGVLFLFLLIAAILVVLLEPALTNAITQAPLIWNELESTVALARDALSGMRDLQENVTDAFVDDPADATVDGDADPEEDLPIPSVFDALSYGPTVIGALLIFVGTLYFFLASRIELYEQMAGAMRGMRVRRLREAERRVAHYFLTVTFINAGFGTLVTLAMMVIGMPQPVLWGIATFLLNFMLYLGPALVATALIVVGLVTFDGAWSFLPVAIFVSLNMVEAQFVTPTLVGQQMSLNPLLVFLSLVGWLWLWGPVGGLVAIPVLVWALYMLTSPGREA